MKLFFLILFLISTSLSAKEIKFDNGKTLNLSQMKEKFKSHKIQTYNYNVRAVETYWAFSFKEILNHIYHRYKWGSHSFIKVNTLDKYAPIIEMYKFKEREPYLAYARADQKNFTSFGDYQEELIDLSPYYLIWKENYKKNAARRRDHWPYHIIGFELQSSPPKIFIPKNDAPKDIHWGYKNFIKQCFACHKLSGVGGDKGGELVLNKTLEKYSDDLLKKFISNPRSINKKSNMPPFAPKIDMRKERISNIVKYLRFVKENHKSSLKRDSKKRSLDELLDSNREAN